MSKEFNNFFYYFDFFTITFVFKINFDRKINSYSNQRNGKCE